MNEFMHMLHDWPHWAFEIVVEVVTAPVFAAFGAFAVRVHDRRKHS